MFSDALVALRRTTAVNGILVVTADTVAQQIGGGHGAGVLDDDGAAYDLPRRRGARESKLG